MTANIKNEIDLYLQDLLSLQFKASSGITHNPTKGNLREKFIKQVVLEQYPNLSLKSGILIDNEWQSTQGDFIWLKNNARVGNFDLYELNDCNLFMEIKSFAKHSEFVHLNEIAGELHRRAQNRDVEHRLIVGMFCYSTEAKDKTILRKFGFKYDKDLQGFCNYNPQEDIFKEINFVISLNILEEGPTTPYMIIRDIYGDCVLYNNNPIISHFFNYFNIE